jgi:hypothetical protein
MATDEAWLERRRSNYPTTSLAILDDCSMSDGLAQALHSSVFNLCRSVAKKLPEITCGCVAVLRQFNVVDQSRGTHPHRNRCSQAGLVLRGCCEGIGIDDGGIVDHDPWRRFQDSLQLLLQL